MEKGGYCSPVGCGVVLESGQPSTNEQPAKNLKDRLDWPKKSTTRQRQAPTR